VESESRKRPTYVPNVEGYPGVIWFFDRPEHVVHFTSVPGVFAGKAQYCAASGVALATTNNAESTSLRIRITAPPPDLLRLGVAAAKADEPCGALAFDAEMPLTMLM